MMEILKTQNIAKCAAKRTAAVGVSSISIHSVSISKNVDFMSAEPFGSALFLCNCHPRPDRGSRLLDSRFRENDILNFNC